MSLHRRAAKRDGNEPAIIAALRQAGAQVEPLSGENIPDLLVAYQGVNFLIECKMPKRKLKPGQRDWHAHWRGQCAVAWSVEDALKIIGALDSEDTP